VALVAGGLTAAVVVGAGVLVGMLRSGGGVAPAPESLDRPPVTASAPSAPASSAPASRPPARTDPAPVAAGPMRAAPRPAASPPSTESRDRRSTPPAPATRTAPRSGRATFYTLAGLPDCGYEGAAASGAYVAMSPADFDGSAACGTVLDVTGPKGTVRVTVSDLCPECQAGHLDLAAPAFARIADPVAGIVPVTLAVPRTRPDPSRPRRALGQPAGQRLPGRLPVGDVEVAHQHDPPPDAGLRIRE